MEPIFHSFLSSDTSSFSEIILLILTSTGGEITAKEYRFILRQVCFAHGWLQEFRGGNKKIMFLICQNSHNTANLFFTNTNTWPIAVFSKRKKSDFCSYGNFITVQHFFLQDKWFQRPQLFPPLQVSHLCLSSLQSIYYSLRTQTLQLVRNTSKTIEYAHSQDCKKVLCVMSRTYTSYVVM